MRVSRTKHPPGQKRLIDRSTDHFRADIASRPRTRSIEIINAYSINHFACCSFRGGLVNLRQPVGEEETNHSPASLDVVRPLEPHLLYRLAPPGPWGVAIEQASGPARQRDLSGQQFQFAEVPNCGQVFDLQRV